MKIWTCLGLCLMVAFSACQSANNAESAENHVDSVGKEVAPEDAPVMKFDKEIFDFGTITIGDQVTHEFKFTNAGESPLIITNATATCGCTVPEYPTHPIKPGESGIIKVVFDSQGKLGVQDKVVTITSNANPTVSSLHVVGEIKAKKD